MYTYKIIDTAGKVITSADDKHEIDTAWDILLKTDEELQKIYAADLSYLKVLIDKHRKPFFGYIELVQVWKTSDWISLLGKKFDEAVKTVPKPYFILASKIDNNIMIWTSDVNFNRIGVEVVDNIIVKVNGIG